MSITCLTCESLGCAPICGTWEIPLTLPGEAVRLRIVYLDSIIYKTITDGAITVDDLPINQELIFTVIDSDGERLTIDDYDLFSFKTQIGHED